MSLQNVVGFWQRVQNDKALQQQVSGLSKFPREERPKELIVIGREKGFTMSESEVLEAEAVLSFWQAVQTDISLQEKLKPTKQMENEAAASREVIEIAKGAGFTFSNDALSLITKAQIQASVGRTDNELSAKQLEEVVGGLTSLSPIQTSYNLALNNQLSPSLKLGPGLVAEYM